MTHRTQKGKYAGLLGQLETLFPPNGLANIISFHRLEELYPITYAWELTTFLVHTRGMNIDEGIVSFKRSPQGFPYLDMEDEEAWRCLVKTKTLHFGCG